MTDEQDLTIEPEDDRKKPQADSTPDGEFVPEEGEVTTEGLQALVKDLRQKLKDAQIEKKDYLEGWQRCKAEAINMRKRDEEDRKERVKFANQDIILQLTPVLDSFTMAFDNKEAWERIDTNWRKGIEYIYSQFIGILAQNGFTEFDPKGEKFDPNRHHAIDTVPVTDESQDHVVLEVVQKGYMLHGKIIRPASVKIGEFKKAE